MKKLLKLIKNKKFLCGFAVSVLLIVVSACFFSCKKKKDDLFELKVNFSNYYIDLEYDDTTKNANVNCEIDFCNNSDALLKEIKLHLYIASFCANAKNKPVGELYEKKAYYNGESFATLTISRVKLNDKDIMPTYEGEDDDIMVVPLNSSLFPDERANIKIEYSFSMPELNHRFGAGEKTTNFGNFYPVVCHYENGYGWRVESYCSTGDPFCSDMANYYVNLCLNENLILASTGNLINEVEDENKKIYYIEALCVRDFAFVVSPSFQVKSKKVDDVVVSYYYTSSNFVDRALTCATEAIKTFSDLFYRYPYKQYSVVQADFCYGGMEYPNLSIISNKIENCDEYLNVIVHETAHQWWYNLVGNDEYNEAWLDESLTEYSTVLFYDFNKGYNYNHKDMVDSAHQNFVFYNNVYENVLVKLDKSMRRPLNEFSTEPEYTFTIYVKGVLMYDSLYNLIGKKNFLKSLKLYASENAYKVANYANLISAFEKVCSTSLEDFFDCWLSGRVIIN